MSDFLKQFEHKYEKIDPRDDDPNYGVPSYSKPGWLMVEITNINPKGSNYRYEYEDRHYDDDSCVFWINEVEGFDFWLDRMSPDEITEPGWYVFEDIVGHYSRGDGWTTDDVDWEYRVCRRATAKEITAEAPLPDHTVLIGKLDRLIDGLNRRETTLTERQHDMDLIASLKLGRALMAGEDRHSEINPPLYLDGLVSMNTIIATMDEAIERGVLHVRKE